MSAMNSEEILSIETLPVTEAAEQTAGAPESADTAAISVEKTPARADGGEKVFTERELERQIEKRLRRERQKNADLDKVRGLLTGLRESGVIKSGSYAGMLAELAGIVPRAADGSCPVPESGKLPPAEAVLPDDDGVMPSGAPREGAEQEEKEACSAVSSLTLADVRALGEQYPGRDVASDLLSEAFSLFADGRRGTPAEVYAGYLRFRGAIGDGAVSSVSSAQKGTERVGGAVFANAAGARGDYLTARQKEIAKSAGLSYREYAEMLASVPLHRQRPSFR